MGEAVTGSSITTKIKKHCQLHITELPEALTGKGPFAPGLGGYVQDGAGDDAFTLWSDGARGSVNYPMA